MLTAHAQLRKFEQPDELGAYDRWELKLGKKTQSQTSPLVKEWADMLLFANYKTFSIAVGKDGKKHKGQGGKRTMYTQHHPCWDAKNRYGLPEECEFDYSVIADIIGGTNTVTPEPVKEGKQQIEIQKPAKDNDFMNIPKDTDEKVDFDTGEKIEETKKEPKVEDSVFHIADYIPKALRDLMYPNLVSEEELMEAVYQRGFFPRGTPFQNLPQEFVEGCLIGAWPQVLDVIKTIRSSYEVPFDK